MREKLHNESQKKVLTVQNDLEKLISKCREVKTDLDAFKKVFEESKHKLRNEQKISNALLDLESELSHVNLEKDNLIDQTEVLRQRFSRIDKTTINIQDGDSLIEESINLINNVNYENDVAIDIHERLRKLISLFKSLVGDQAERLKLLEKVKFVIEDNKELLRQMKIQLGDTTEKNENFQKLYNSMVKCEAFYAQRKA